MRLIPAQDDPHPGFLTVAQLFVSAFGLLGALASAVILLVIGRAGLFTWPAQGASAAAIFSLVCICVLVAALACPSIFFSLQRLRGINPSQPSPTRFRAATIGILLWPFVLAIGSRVSTQMNLPWVFLPILQALAVSLPLWWVIEFASRGLPTGSRQRGWGIINFSLFITTPLLIVVEALGFLLLLVILVVWLMGQPAILRDLESLVQNMPLVQTDPEAILPVIMPYLQKPAVLVSVLAGLSGVIPLVEELIKPLALWLLIGRRLTPAEGFTGGALCGGTFALLESLLALSNSTNPGWLAMTMGRAGTGILHISATALTGWAIASARQKGSYLHLALVYLFSAGVHGLWNALGVFLGIRSLIEYTSNASSILAHLAQAAPATLILLGLSLLALLWAANHRLRQIPPHPEPIVYNVP